MGEFTHKGTVYIYDNVICMHQGNSEYLVLTRAYNFNGTIVPSGFVWNGASSPNTPLARFIAPKFYKNIKASCVHDYLCGLCKNAKERAEADMIYFLIKKYIEQDQEFKCLLGLWGVRLGAFLGIGSNYK